MKNGQWSDVAFRTVYVSNNAPLTARVINYFIFKVKY
jgi:hypothetical protein